MSQEDFRWNLQGFRAHPTISVIEPKQKDDAEANTPFGFARILKPELEPETPREIDCWEGQGL